MMGDFCIPRMQSMYLRAFSLEDVTDVYQGWVNDPEVNQYLNVRHTHQTIESLEDYVQNALNDPFLQFFAVMALDEDLMVGTLNLRTDTIHQIAYYGFLIGNKKYWGSSLPLEAQISAIDHALIDLSLRKVWGGTYGRNTAMHFNFKKLGFQREGVLREQVIGADGQADDEYNYGLLKHEWLKHRKKLKNYMPGNYRQS